MLRRASFALIISLVCALLFVAAPGCGKSRRTNFVPFQEAFFALIPGLEPPPNLQGTQPNARPTRVVLSTDDALIAEIEVEALEQDLILHSIDVHTTLGMDRMRVVSVDGFTATDEVINFHRDIFHLEPGSGSPNLGQIFTIPQKFHRKRFQLFADTSDWRNQLMTVSIFQATVSHELNRSPHLLGLNYMFFDVYIEAALFLVATPINTFFDYRLAGKGTRDVLAQFRITETSNQGSAGLYRLTASLSEVGINNLALADAGGNIIAGAERDPNFTQNVIFNLGASPLNIAPGQSVVISIVGDVRNSPTVGNTINTEVRTLQFVTANNNVFLTTGPKDATGQLQVFTAVY